METLYFDARYIRVNHHDGISRFSVGLLHALHKRMPVIAVVHDPAQLELLPAGMEHVFLNAPTSPMEFLAAHKLNKLGAKLVYSPMQTIGSLGRKFKLVLTLHDLIYYKHPAPPPALPFWVKVGWRLYHLSYLPARLALNNCEAVVTVSETTKQLIGKHHLTRKTVAVVYNAAGNDQASTVAPRVRAGKRAKLVYMGSFMGYKNVETLIEGMNHLPRYELHLLSPISKEREMELRSLATGAELVFHRGVSEAEYLRILDESVALVTASKDEGFGIPLVEAMARAIPVVASDIPIFREIAGEAAHYFNPRDAQGFARAVLDLENETEWLNLSKAGYERAKDFNWDESAAALIRLLETI